MVGRSIAFVAMFLIAGCDRPIFNMAKLQEVRLEALQLMATKPVRRGASWRELPSAEWPPTIASLHPKRVTIYSDSVDIVTRPFFDGGWGYNVPRSMRGLPMPVNCYSEPSEGVFWHGPC
jgi:hypothetical protein